LSHPTLSSKDTVRSLDFHLSHQPATVMIYLVWDYVRGGLMKNQYFYFCPAVMKTSFLVPSVKAMQGILTNPSKGDISGSLVRARTSSPTQQ
jgi:hypothetical protein